MGDVTDVISLPRPEGLIFDLDGLLLDSERLHLNCFTHVITELGYEPLVDVFQDCIGTTNVTSDTILRLAYGDDFPLDELAQLWGSRYHRLIDEGQLEVKPGAIELLEFARESGIACALATSTRRKMVLKNLSIVGLADFFAFSVTGDDVTVGKPHPQPYSKAADGLQLLAAECWAMEDSENGVRSALAAGCHVIQVPDMVEPRDDLRALGHVVASSLLDVLNALR